MRLQHRCKRGVVVQLSSQQWRPHSHGQGKEYKTASLYSPQSYQHRHQVTKRVAKMPERITGQVKRRAETQRGNTRKVRELGRGEMRSALYKQWGRRDGEPPALVELQSLITLCKRVSKRSYLDLLGILVSALRTGQTWWLFLTCRSCFSTRLVLLQPLDRTPALTPCGLG